MFWWLSKLINGQKKIPKTLPQAESHEAAVSSQVIRLGEKIDQMEQVLQATSKTLRRLHLSIDQNAIILREMQTIMKEKLLSPPQAAGENYQLSERQLLAWLDSSTEGQETDPTAAALGSKQILLQQLGWEPIAQVNTSYHPLDCEVLEAVADTCEPGTVRQIVQQGYRSKDQRLIRRAKVIVAKATSLSTASAANQYASLS